jgi:hypothetical protein
MNTINMPGFSAEASLYRTSEHYQRAKSESAMRTVTDPSILAGRQQILPQAMARPVENTSSCVCPCRILVCDDAGKCTIQSC